MRRMFGWDLPPGVTQRMIDEQAGVDVPNITILSKTKRRARNNYGCVHCWGGIRKGESYTCFVLKDNETGKLYSERAHVICPQPELDF
jgi:hypothetical protein